MKFNVKPIKPPKSAGKRGRPRFTPDCLIEWGEVSGPKKEKSKSIIK